MEGYPAFGLQRQPSSTASHPFLHTIPPPLVYTLSSFRYIRINIFQAIFDLLNPPTLLMATLTLVDHAFTFLSVYREQHVSRRPSQPLPRVSLSLQRQQPSSGYSVCQARLWEALLTHALSPLQTAKYFLECLFANSTICSLQAHTASNLPVICYFESHVLTEPIRVAFAACSRAILHDFLLPRSFTPFPSSHLCTN